MNIELDLLTACIRSERKAEYELYKMTYGYLMSICFRYTNSREEAEEMLNIGFLKILRNLEKYKLEIPFKLWIRRIMINILIDEFRRNKKHKETIEYVDGYYETGETCDENAVISKMNVDEIHELIMKLPAMSQKVFNLYIIDGYSHKEIADLLKMSEGTSKWHLNQSRNRLKEMLTKITVPLPLKP